MADKISEKVISIKFDIAKRSNSKDELIKFQNEFPISPYQQEVFNLIEELDYSKAISLNTIDSYSSYLKSYPKSNKSTFIQSKLELLSWEKCLQINTKESFQTFINDFPNSTKLQEAKMMLSKFVDVYNLEQINSFLTLSFDKQMFEPFKISDGNLNHPKLTLLKISHDGKTALAITSFANGVNRIESDNIACLIDLTDGAIYFEFAYVSLSNYFFNSDDSKLFYYDDKFISQIDLKSFEITKLFQVESKADNFQYMCIENNTIHFCQDQYETPRKKILHYTFDLSTAKKDLEVFYEFDYSVKGDIQKEFNSLSGSIEHKLLMLKLLHGDDIKIKPLSKNSKDEYLIVDIPNVFILKNGQFIYNNSLKIFKTDKITKQVKVKSDVLVKRVQLTDNNRIVFADNFMGQEALYILQLGSEDGTIINGEVNINQVDPFKIDILSGEGEFLFVELNEMTGKLFYQIDIGSMCNYDDDYEIYVFNSNKFSTSINGMQEIIKNKLDEIDRSLSSFYNAHISAESIKNKPLESDSEKYLRVKNVYNDIKPSFIKMKDSLFQILNNTVIDSIKIDKPDLNKVFVVSNYNQVNESWRLIFENPYSGKDFSLIYPQPKAEAKLNLSNNYANINIEVKYYFNLLSLAYEPLLVSITNIQTRVCNNFIIPYNDASLSKNLYLTDNSIVQNSHLVCILDRGDIYYDENILRYFVSNGVPKYFFNYGFVDPTRLKKTGVSILNLDNPALSFNFQNHFEECCPELDYTDKGNYKVGGTYLRFDEVNYFINQCEEFNSKNQLEASVYEINKISPLEKIGNIVYPNGESPNGKYSVDISGIYEKASGNYLLKFQNASGKVYWDCNSYFFGIGQNLFPVSLLEKVLKL
jgi:hypothetical protein